MSRLLRKLRRLIRFSWFMLGVSACSTLPKYIEVQLPAYASALFTECSGQNGVLNFQFMLNGNAVESIDLEWAAKATGDWGLASYSPMGQTLFQMQFSKESQSLVAGGRKGEWLSDLTLESTGFLRFKQQKVGLRADEFPCYWSGRMPRNWLRKVLEFSQDGEGLLLRIQDQERQIIVHIAKHGGGLPWIWQSSIDWDLYWGLQHHSLQLQARQNKSVVLSSLNFKDLECLWLPKDED